MLINQGNLQTLSKAYKTAFQNGLGMAESQYLQVATVVPSTTGSEEYGWLGQAPNMREWVGDRVIHGVATHGYTVKNRSFEVTQAVPRTAIEDDQYGVYTPLMVELGRGAGAHPDQLTFGLLKQGRSALCYDGQPFFSATHPVLNEKGKPAVQSNVDDSGEGTDFWFVMDTTRAIKPILFQDRKKPEFVAMQDPTDESVFKRNEFVYGVDSRCNVGFGFWQMAQSSNKDLTSTNLWNAIQALEGRKGDHGRPLGLRANLLVVASTREKEATKLLNNDLVAEGGAAVSNELKGRLKLLKAEWL